MIINFNQLGSSSRVWQDGGGSFLLLPGRHALSSRWLWAFNHNTSENRWKKFKELIPVLSSCHLSFKTRGRVYSSCVRRAMLHASETWPLTKPSLQCLQRNDRAMIRQICKVKPQDTANIRSTELLAQLSIEDLDLILKDRRLLWYGHVERSNGAVMTAFDIQIVRKCGPGRPKMTWKQLTERDCRVEALNYQPSWQRHLEIWCKICYACSKPVTWKGAHCCGYCPCTCTLIKKIWWWWWWIKTPVLANCNSACQMWWSDFVTSYVTSNNSLLDGKASIQQAIHQ